MEININPKTVQAQLQKVLKECSDSITLGLQAIENMDAVPTKPEIKITDEKFDVNKPHPEFSEFRIGKPEMNFDTQKDNFKKWIFKKGFEDLIKGINLALIDAYFYISILKLNGNTYSITDLEKEIVKLRKNALDQQSLPQLLQKINLNESLQFESKILSINKVRNCLVHRNGIVTAEKDINDKLNNVLRLEYLNLELVNVDADGKETLERINTGIGVMIKAKEKKFQIGEEITINYSEFKSLLFTAMHFGIDLESKLPVK